MIRIKFLVGMCFLLGFYILDFQVPRYCAMPIQEDKARDNFERMYELITQRLKNLTGDSQSNDQNVRRSFVPVNTTVIKNSSMENQFATNSAYDMRPVDSPANYMINRGTINTGQKVGPVSYGSLDRVSIPEDSSSFYTNLQVETPTYDRKNTIYRQPSQTNGQQATFNYGHGLNDSYDVLLAGPTVKAEPPRNGYNFQETNDYVNNRARGYGQSYYAGYQQTQIPAQETQSDSSYSQSNHGYQHYYPIGVQQGRTWPGYQASPGYQVRYPGYSFPGNQTSSTVTRDKVPQLSGPRIDNNNTTDENVTLQASDEKDMTRVPPESTIRAKFPQESVEKALFLPKKLPTKEIPSSGSGSDVDETFSLESANQQHSQDLVSGSGSGNEDLSDVAFMLAGTNNVKPQRPVPGLPVNLTRQQALDIFKSALYFAGLMRSEGLEDLASSGDDFTADDDDDDDSDVSQQTENIDNDNDDTVRLTDNDVKEALAATSGEQESSGQNVKDIEASGSQEEVSTRKAEDKGKEVPKQSTSSHDKDGSKTQKATKATPATESEAKNKDSESESKNSDGEVTKVKEAAVETQATNPPADSVAEKFKSEKPATSADKWKSSSSDEKDDSGKSTGSEVGVVDSDESESTTEESEKEKDDSDKSLASADGGKSSPPVANGGYTINSHMSNPSADGTASKGPGISSTTSTDIEGLKDDSDMPPPIEIGSPVQTPLVTPQSSSLQSSSQLLNAPQPSSAAVRPQTAASLFDNVHQTDLSSPISQRAIICKDTIQRISCPPQQRIRIQNADYGDTGSVGCLKEANPMPGGMCRTPGAYETVKRQCEGRELCDLSASNDMFGDACPDANKYLDVQYDCMNKFALRKFQLQPAPGKPPAINLSSYVMKFNVPASYPPAVPGYGQVSYQAAPQYMNPPPPPVSYAPAPYPYPQAPAVPDLIPASPYVAPDPCSPCNTCVQCSLPVCNTCTQTCHSLTCGPRIPAKLQPLWQQWNERTADMNRMEMSALIISPVPKLLSPTKAPTKPSETTEGSESGESSADEDALYDMDTEKRSGIQRVKTEKTKTSKDAKSKTEQGFLASSDLIVSSGDSSGASST